MVNEASGWHYDLHRAPLVAHPSSASHHIWFDHLHPKPVLVTSARISSIVRVSWDTLLASGEVTSDMKTWKWQMESSGQEAAPAEEMPHPHSSLWCILPLCLLHCYVISTPWFYCKTGGCFHFFLPTFRTNLIFKCLQKLVLERLSVKLILISSPGGRM